MGGAKKMKHLVEIDLEKNGLRVLTVKEKETADLVRELYQMIWIEAKYDPSCGPTEYFANKLLPKIQAVRDNLGLRDT